MAFLAAIAAAGPLFGQPIKLAFPLDCVLGQTCYIDDYVDLDPGPVHTHYRCGIKSRNGHNFTDISLVSEPQMTRGVNATAAAAGYVRAIRNGMPDQPISARNRASIAGKNVAIRLRCNVGAAGKLAIAT